MNCLIPTGVYQQMDLFPLYRSKNNVCECLWESGFGRRVETRKQLLPRLLLETSWSKVSWIQGEGASQRRG